MGESGSGKSTAVKCLYFDQPPTSGNATFYDKGKKYDLFDMNAAQQRQLANKRFGMVYQNPHLGLNFDISGSASCIQATNESVSPSIQ